jgi:hypothetical protein
MSWFYANNSIKKDLEVLASKRSELIHKEPNISIIQTGAESFLMRTALQLF